MPKPRKPKSDPAVRKPATKSRRPRKAAAIKDESKVRLQKVMAEAGLGSRRACEQMIEDGLVRVNGRTVRELPVLVDPAIDQVEVEGDVLPLGERGGGRHLYVMLYKPRHTVTTLSDPAGRRTVAEIVRHPSGIRLYPVGRLDYDTMGLLLMTNDGELANRLTHPRYGVHKRYRAVVKGVLTEDQVEKLEQGVYLAERRQGRPSAASRTAGAELRIAKKDPARTVLDITLSEGRNRQVRRMLAKAGCPVKKLVRIQMGPLKLKGLALGEWRELTLTEIQSLRKAAGIASRSSRGGAGESRSPSRRSAAS